MNLPNRLSMFRIVAVPVFLALLLVGDWIRLELPHLTNAILRGAALILTIAVTYTDWLDGHIARTRGLVTNLGKLLDPLADKIFVTAALVAFVELDLVPAWAVIVVVAREFLVTGLRSLAADAGRVISADTLGKHKTAWQLTLIITGLVVIVVRDALSHFDLWAGIVRDYHGATIFHTMIWIPLVMTLGFTIVSGWNYLYHNRDLFAGEL